MMPSNLKELRLFYSKIPDKLWLMFAFQYGKRACAIGHLYQFDNPAKLRYLQNLLVDKIGKSLGDINDGLDPRFRQSTPKKRILAALDLAISR